MLFLINGAFSNRFYNKTGAFSMVLHGIIGAFSNNIDIKKRCVFRCFTQSNRCVFQ